MSAEDAEALGLEIDRYENIVSMRERIQETLESLQDLERQGLVPSRFVEVLSATLRATDSAMGECQLDTPYAALRPVISPDGKLKWCCSHMKQHCVSGA